MRQTFSDSPNDPLEDNDELDDAFDFMPLLLRFAAAAIFITSFANPLLAMRRFARVAGGEYKNCRLLRFVNCFSNRSYLP